MYDSEVEDETSRLEKVFQEDTFDLVRKLPNALTKALVKVVSSMKKILVPERAQPPQPRPWPLKVVLGLSCPRLWDKEMQAKGTHSTMPDLKDKGV